jgi:hypothetical protein
LRAEGYSQGVIVGPYLSGQLRQLIREVNPKSYSNVKAKPQFAAAGDNDAQGTSIDSGNRAVRS